MAEWPCSGLQLHVRRFDSDSSLHSFTTSAKPGVARGARVAAVNVQLFHLTISPERDLPQTTIILTLHLLFLCRPQARTYNAACLPEW